MPDDSGIVLQGINVIRQERTILSIPAVTLTERRIGVVGRNGSGKSTLARLVCGLIAPTAGVVRVGGIDVVEDRRSAIRATGILFQNPDHQIIFPTVEEELAFGVSQLGSARAEAREAAHGVLRRFDRAHWAERSIHTLSQGQRHLVCLMAVLVMQPRVIVLDEPFAGLDIPTSRALSRYLGGLDQQIVHITHEPSALAGHDRVLWLERGEIRSDDLPDKVLPEFRAAMEDSDDRSDLTD